jgi:hypothetical protein
MVVVVEVQVVVAVVLAVEVAEEIETYEFSTVLNYWIKSGKQRI